MSASGYTVDDRPDTIAANRKEFGMESPEILNDFPVTDPVALATRVQALETAVASLLDILDTMVTTQDRQNDSLRTLFEITKRNMGL